MVIWLLIFLLFGLFAAIGYSKGAVRMLVSLAGFVVAIFLAIPLGRLLEPYMPKIGVTHPLLKYLLAPVIVYLVISLIFVGVSFYIHRLVNLRFKYKSGEDYYLNWEKMNHRIGLSLGLLTGAIYCILIGSIIYTFGYWTVQLASDNDPGWLKFFDQARYQLQKTGLARTVSEFDPASNRFYKMADLAGLLYHNPLLKSRLAVYPPYLKLSWQQTFEDLGNDTSLQNQWQTQDSILSILKNPKVVGVLTNSELLSQITSVDLNDLQQYLRTGDSPKYSDEPILGRWKASVSATLRQVKQEKPTITGQELMALKRFGELVLSGVMLSAMPGQQIEVRYHTTDSMQKLTQKMSAAKPKTPANQSGDMGAAAQQYSQRYNLQRPTARPAPKPKLAPQGMLSKLIATFNESITKLGASFTGQGSWAYKSGTYTLQYKGGNNKTHTFRGFVLNDRLVLRGENLTLVLLRIY